MRDLAEISLRVEAGLCANYHYAHARRLGQLRHVRMHPVCDGMRTYRAKREKQGYLQSSIKPPVLSLTPYHP